MLDWCLVFNKRSRKIPKRRYRDETRILQDEIPGYDVTIRIYVKSLFSLFQMEFIYEIVLTVFQFF